MDDSYCDECCQYNCPGHHWCDDCDAEECQECQGCDCPGYECPGAAAHNGF
ncbi:hypothetical protein [Streptomyces sp. MJM1172]|uniref:hypothetical protein n=1 Tax=Streptomyces sp. MJM1172 TaxID=1703926 RepID=UPI000AFB8E34|nr:hypothetical protein [Streptomyces sp. MJM1172]